MDITDLKAAADRLAQGQAEMSSYDLPTPTGPHRLLSLFSERTGPQIIDAAAINGRVELEVELFEP